MQVTKEKIAACLTKVEEVREYFRMYCVEPMGPVLNLANLHYAIQDICGVEISVNEVSFESRHLRGTTERYQVDGKKFAKVYIQSEQLDAGKRLTVAKELCHILVDCEGDWSTDGVETIRSLLQDMRLFRDNGVGDEAPSDPLVSEAMAHIAAIELLYPDEYRDADAAKLESRQKTIAQIAIEHEIPQHAVEQALDFHADLEDIWKEVRGG
jgi:Zn-dependent peptidase ImmA (M78 family)